MSGVLGPFQEPGFGPTFADLLARIQNLERARQRAVYEIKVFGDDEQITVGDGLFRFAIPDQLYAWQLTRTSMFVTTTGAGDTTVQIENNTQAVDMLLDPMLIAGGGDFCCTGSDCGTIDPDNDTVAGCDLIWIDVDEAAAGAMGLGVILEFSP